MDGIIFDNLGQFIIPMTLNDSSDSDVKGVDKIINQEKIIADKFSLLKKDVGEKLYNQLSYEKKMFIVNVTGTINLGNSVDIYSIYKRIENLDHE
ncbi:MAG: hypothetical protein V1732_02695 [Patescibacteria group bacterium]|nr:hypothetical protein [Patescibacteria group bacterium]MBU4141495.1 hypothetical protein [Patescibacteria group bacterium]